jgi:hypothetical protein
MHKLSLQKTVMKNMKSKARFGRWWKLWKANGKVERWKLLSLSMFFYHLWLRVLSTRIHFDCYGYFPFGYALRILCILIIMEKIQYLVALSTFDKIISETMLFLQNLVKG